MPGSTRTDGLDRFQRSCTAQRSRGLKLLRVTVPNPRAPGFQEEAHRQALLVRGAPEETEALDFVEAAADLAP